MALFVALLGIASCLAYNTKDPVIDVTYEDFDEFQQEFHLSLRLYAFYGSKSDNASFFGTLYRVSRKLQEQFPKIILAKIDLSKPGNSRLAAMHGVTSLPGIVVYLQGSTTYHQYPGLTDERSILKYANDKLFNIHSFKSVSEFEDFTAKEASLDGVLLGVFNSKDSAEYAVFETFSRENMHRLRFGEAINQTDFNERYEVTQDSLVLVRGALLESQPGVYIKTPALSSGDNLEVWLSKSMYGFIGHYNPLTEHFVAKSDRPLAVLFFDFDVALNPSIIKYYVNKLRRSVSESWSSPENKNLFSFAIAKKADYKDLLEDEGLYTQKVFLVIKRLDSTIVLQEPQVLTTDQKLNGKAINQACFDYVNGELTEYIKSEPEPKKPIENSVRVVVGSNLQEVVKRSGKHVLLLLYASGYSDHAELVKLFEKLGAGYDKLGNVLIAKMEGRNNRHPYECDLPSIIFHPAVRKDKWVRFEKEFTLEDIKDFLDQAVAKEDAYIAGKNDSKKIDVKKQEKDSRVKLESVDDRTSKGPSKRSEL